ncbi:unnamed protein product [Vicia faba]|uniref:Uncharacterized protein n=1 Tax=Vicia faba TaxID=3906 RepID=A0AAV1AU10_VICFA|nr:unnamed protein product [Vicia faba]
MEKANGEEVWTKVVYNSKRRKQRASTGTSKGEAKSSSFFITEFAEKFRARDLYQFLKEVGDIDEVIISAKRDIREGFFPVKVTPLGANVCLLEDLVKGEMKALLEGGRNWLGQWLKEVKSWSSSLVDPERIVG